MKKQLKKLDSFIAIQQGADLKIRLAPNGQLLTERDPTDEDLRNEKRYIMSTLRKRL
jgi:hypothetical protein